MACLPNKQSCACSVSAIFFRIFATAKVSNFSSVSTWMARSAPIANAVRNTSSHFFSPSDTTTTSLILPASFKRTASSTAISSNGFIDILTLPISTSEPSAFTRTFTLKSTTRLTATNAFMHFPFCINKIKRQNKRLNCRLSVFILAENRGFEYRYRIIILKAACTIFAAPT